MRNRACAARTRLTGVHSVLSTYFPSLFRLDGWVGEVCRAVDRCRRRERGGLRVHNRGIVTALATHNKPRARGGHQGPHQPAWLSTRKRREANPITTDTPLRSTTTASPSAQPQSSASLCDVSSYPRILTHLLSGVLAAGFGGAAGFFALFFFAEVPKVRDDIMKKIPILDKFFTVEIAPEDNPF
jgi:hypothetical protein